MDLYKKIEKSFPAIEKLFTKKELDKFKNIPIKDLYIYHFDLGLWIRNNLLRENNNELYKLLLNNGIKYIDDMSALILLRFHQYLNK